MASVALEPASRFTHAELAEIFTAGYEGYYTPFSVDEAAFRFMSTIWDDDLDSSRVALVDGEPAGICKLAIRGDRGWIAGIGISPRAPRQGRRRAVAARRHRRRPRARPARALARGARPERAGDPALREARLRARPRARGVDARERRSRERHGPRRSRWKQRRRGSRASGRSVSRGSVRTRRSRTSTPSRRSRATAARSSSARRADERRCSRPSRPTRRQPRGCSRRWPTRCRCSWLNGPVGDPFNAAIEALGGTCAHRQHEMLLPL